MNFTLLSVAAMPGLVLVSHLMGNLLEAHQKSKDYEDWKKKNLEKVLKKGNQLNFFILSICLSFCIPKAAAQPPAGFTDEIFMDGWTAVVGFTFDDNGRMFVWERRGQVWIVENGVKSATPLIDIEEEVGNWGDYGLIGFALDPDFLTNGYFYLNYVVDRHHLLNFGTPAYNPNTNTYNNATIGRVTRYQANGATNFTSTLPNSRFVLIGETKETGMPILHSSHGVGSIVFGEDHTLLINMGDGASFSSVDQGSANETFYAQALTDGIITPAENIGAYRSQAPFSLNGKILRIDPVTGDGLPSNPFWDGNNPRSAQSRTWASGVRNPYRMSRIPETGDHNPANGDPGIFLFGDVGWGQWEDLHVVNAPGLNFGWPKWEGINNMPGYNNPTWEPAVHERPKLDWRHGQNIARGLINGSVVSVGSPQLPGTPFAGNAATGGIWYQGEDFPTAYKDTYFVGDYGTGWIRNIEFDANFNPTKVNEFINNSGPVVHFGTHPTTGGLYYVRYPNQIRLVSFTGSGNQSPTAVASSNLSYGASPLLVNFTGDQSYDPENGELTYLWNFGDGNTSTDANPSHNFTAGGIMTYTVSLTVTDDQTQTNLTDLIISLNNTPPVINSTSIENTDFFNPNVGANLNLNAVVTDAEHTLGQLTFSWVTALVHNGHSHEEPEDNNPNTTTILPPIGCTGATYYYTVSLVVTDPEGLSATYVKNIFPNCPGVSQTITFSAIPNKQTIDPSFSISPTASSGLPVATFVVEGPALISSNQITLTGQPGLVTIRAIQSGDATFAPAAPVEQSFTVINVPPPPNNFVTVGDASANGGSCFTVTPDINSQAGAVWYDTQIDLSEDFLIEMDVNMGSSDAGADGMAFVLQNEGLSAIGMLGGALGAYNIDNSLVVEFDGWDNGGDDIADDHTAFKSVINGMQNNLTSPICLNSGCANVEDGQDHYVRFEWDASSQKLDFYFDNVLRQSYASNIIGAFFGGNPNVYFGMTGGTGGASNLQTFCLLNLELGEKLDQTINFPPLSNKLTTDPPFAISAIASSGLPVSFSIVSGPATISGNSITLNGSPGTVIVRASQAGNTLYNPAPSVDQSFIVNPPTGGNVDLEISLSASPNDPNVFSNFTITATLINTSSNPTTGVKVHFPEPNGLVLQGGNEYSASQGTYAPFGSNEWDVGTLAGGASATLDLNFFMLSSPIDAFAQVIAANELDIDSTPNNGTCCIGSEDDEAGLTVPTPALQNQTIIFPSIPDKEISDPPFSISATASSGLPVNFSIVSGPATVSGSTITLTGQEGTVVVRASQAGNGLYNPAPDVEQSFLVVDPTKMDQTIAFFSIPDKLTDDPPFMLNATASSGLPVTFTVLSGPATVSDDIVTLTGNPGMVTIRASQAGNASFNPAPDVNRIFNVSFPQGFGDIDLELTMSANPPDPTQWGNFTVTATLTNNGGPMTATGVELDFPKPIGVVYQGGNSHTASQGSYNPFGNQVWNVGSIAPGNSATLELHFFLLTANPVTSYAQVTAANEIDVDSAPNNGICCIANEDDEAAITIPDSGPQNQTISFPSILDKDTTDPPYSISATATSGLPVTFSIDSGPATISGNTITLNGTVGAVVVRASQGGDANWNPAPDATRSFNVIDGSILNQTITFNPLPNKITTDPPFSISATASSGLPVTLTIDSGPATISGNTITLNGTTGTVVVRASQAGNATYNPAADVTQNFSVNNPSGGNDIDLELNMISSSNSLNIWNNNTFTLTITNNSGVDASGVIVDAPVPSGDLAYTSSTASHGSYNLFTQAWDVGDLDANETATLDLVLFVLQDANPLDYFVEVSAATPTDSDSTPGNGSCCTANEDDEAIVTLQPPSQAAIGTSDEMLSLFAIQEGTSTRLRWVNNTGFKTDQFVVQHSVDGMNYSPIKYRSSEGATSYIITYRDWDRSPEVGTNYYRIQQQYFDGTVWYSNVSKVEFAPDIEDFIIFPNPANNYVEVNLKPFEGRTTYLKVFNQQGRTMYEIDFEEAPRMPHRIDLTDFVDGHYMVWVRAKGKRPVFKGLVVSRL